MKLLGLILLVQTIAASGNLAFTPPVNRRPQRFVSFPCPATNPVNWGACTDPLEAERAIFHGPDSAWAKFQICREVINDTLICKPLVEMVRVAP